MKDILKRIVKYLEIANKITSWLCQTMKVCPFVYDDENEQEDLKTFKDD